MTYFSDIIKRSHFDITIDVLGVISLKPIGRTRIMYAANLNNKTLKSILKDLQKKGLVVTVPPTNNHRKKTKYVLTPQGHELMKHIKYVMEALFNEPPNYY